jgi:hypothetical protein
MTGNPQAWDFVEATTHAREAMEEQRAAEGNRESAAVDLAEAERLYRKALAKKIVELHDGGAAWSTCADLARGDDGVADLRYARDLAKGMLDVAETQAWRHNANRRELLSFIEWSKHVAPLGEQRPRAA